VTCTAVRERLTEHALGGLSARESTAVDRHLAWCAACRKEAGELERASATLAFAVAPQDPPAALEDRVVDAVRRVAAPQSRVHMSGARRSRLTLVAAAAAMLAVLGTGWGAVMANRAARSDQAAQREVERTQSALERFEELVRSLEFGDPENEVLLGSLHPAKTGGGGGSALTLVSPTIADMAIVLVEGVPDELRDRLPLTVRLRGPQGALLVGRIDGDGLDDGGAGTVTREFADLTGYDTVIVRDVGGGVVLRGSMQTRATVTSPSP
jgi:predicted anti-sigma-YlaC factor YlaD